MKVELTDVYGQTITYYDVASVFASNVEDDVLCILRHGEKLTKINLKALNYWGVYNGN